MWEHTYIAIDLKSFYASVECAERGLDPLTTNLVVADVSRTEKTICLAVSPSLKSYGISGRARLFEVIQRVQEVNQLRLQKAPGKRFTGSSWDDNKLKADPSLALDYIAAPPQMEHYMACSAGIYQSYLEFIAPEDIHVYSVDEVFIDATAYLNTYGCTGRDLAMRMVRRVLNQTGVTATVGIGENLYLCKVALDIVAKRIPADKDGVRMTDANGEYEISVPIGNHLIEAYKNGHRLTSFPLDGSTYDFKKAEVVNFVDSTLVNVTGRINGGFSDQNAPLGFKQSVNRLGKATIKLSLGKEDECSFNYITDERGNRDYGKVDIPVESATDSIKSTAYRPALKKNNSDTYYICITTDEKTGEFSALLPPLKYKVESITFDNDENGNIYNNLSVFSQNLPIIDATNTVKEKMRVDSINVDGLVTQKYEYSAKMLRQYRANPQISVFQKSPLLAKKEKDKPVRYLFGESKIAISNVDQTVDSVAIITQNGDNYTYNFGYPLYQQDREYQYDIDISETYVNLDTKETFTEIPRDAVIHIANDASSTTTVFAERGTINGEVVELGQPYETHIIDITPDENGHVDYAFVAGWPNFASSHLVNWSVAATVDGRTTLWQAPDSKTDALDMIVLGSIGSGIEGLLGSGLGSIIGIIAQIPKLILDLAGAIKNFVTGILDALTELISLRWIDDLVVSILDAVGNLIDAIFDLPENLFKVLESIVVNGVGGLLDGVIGRIGNILTFGALSSRW